MGDKFVRTEYVEMVYELRSLSVLALAYRGAVHETDIVYFPLPTELRARTRA